MFPVARRAHSSSGRLPAPTRVDGEKGQVAVQSIKHTIRAGGSQQIKFDLSFNIDLSSRWLTLRSWSWLGWPLVGHALVTLVSCAKRSLRVPYLLKLTIRHDISPPQVMTAANKSTSLFGERSSLCRHFLFFRKSMNI